jgi:hypothetical protein
MTDAEFSQWLDDEVEANHITTGQREDLLAQKANFEKQRTVIEHDHANQVVGFVAGQMRVANDMHALLDTSKAQFPNNVIYFEPIGFHLL